MIAQAEHIPVHLGAMPEAVDAVRAHDPAPGETWIVNDPYTGGTHLPDITLVSRTELGYAVTRAHHADVGGSEPGSMPAASTRLEDEGVVIPPTRLDEETLAALVARMRNPEDVLEPTGGELPIRVAVTVDGDEVELDFAGTSPQHEGNLNCPLAVTRSAAYFVVRCLTAPDVPASGGAYAPVAVLAPEGSLVNARAPGAVAAGNVETSGRIVDVLFRAFGRAVPVPAQGQGTMNNVTLGNARFTYYETIGGGQGACPDSDGPSGVHVAMSNTLSTPVEALELQYPLRVERYGLRTGSGGAGARRGGDGVVRELRALEACRLSIISERRTNAPQ